METLPTFASADFCPLCLVASFVQCSLTCCGSKGVVFLPPLVHESLSLHLFPIIKLRLFFHFLSLRQRERVFRDLISCSITFHGSDRIKRLF